jgi:hypothetical protein
MKIRSPIKYAFILIISLLAESALCDIERDAQRVQLMISCGVLVDSNEYERFIYRTDKESRASAHKMLVETLKSRYPKEDIDKMFLNAIFNGIGAVKEGVSDQKIKEVLRMCRDFFDEVKAGE